VRCPDAEEGEIDTSIIAIGIATELSRWPAIYVRAFLTCRPFTPSKPSVEREGEYWVVRIAVSVGKFPNRVRWSYQDRHGDMRRRRPDQSRTPTARLSRTDLARPRTDGARPAGPPPVPADTPISVQRRVSSRGGIQVIGQRVQVGFRHAGSTVTIEVEDTMLRVLDQYDHVRTVVPPHQPQGGQSLQGQRAHRTRPGPGSRHCPVPGHA
jgi:hypothetical protein